MTDDMALVREYAGSNSEVAFATLVSRHVNLVYSVALQQVHDQHLAEEITQAVFIILARKAGKLSSKTILSGWLCRTVRYVSANALKIEWRRKRREQEAHMQSILNEPESEGAWKQIAPLLSVALAQLSEKDHDAIVLRFFEGKNMNEVGVALGVSKNTAKTRVSRAVDKLRRFFMKRGVVLSASVIAGAISANSVQAAPVGLATAVSAAKGTVVVASTANLITTTLKIMAWSKAKTAILAGVAVILTVGVVTGLVSISTTKPKGSSQQPADSASKQNTGTTADRRTPKGTMLVMANAMEAGDAKTYVESYVLATTEELKLKSTLEAMIVAMARFNDALSNKFGGEAAHSVFADMPFAFPTNRIDSLEQKIQGDSATVSLGEKAGRPIQFTKVNGEWRMQPDSFVHLSPAVLGDLYVRVIKALDETTPEISQDKFKTAMEAVDKMKERAR